MVVSRIFFLGEGYNFWGGATILLRGYKKLKKAHQKNFYIHFVTLLRDEQAFFGGWGWFKTPKSPPGNGLDYQVRRQSLGARTPGTCKLFFEFLGNFFQIIE